MKQDLHLHTTYSSSDGAIVDQQTLDLIARVKHADIIGISDHFECLYHDNSVLEYIEDVKNHGFRLGVEVNGAEWVDYVLEYDFEYFVYHCWNKDQDYKAIEKMILAGKPVIIAHPYALETNLDRIPRECLIEINNRYIFRFDWKNYLKDYVQQFRFVINSDAHQPNWLNQHVAQYVANEMGIEQTILFSKHATKVPC